MSTGRRRGGGGNFQSNNTIRDGGSAPLQTADTVDTVYNVDVVYTVGMRGVRGMRRTMGKSGVRAETPFGM